MDISEINNVISRKRLTSDAEKIRERMSRERSKIIKIKVQQDSAYWDLQQKLSATEADHERLQQNMLELQMQHEALSAQYQDELRQRPEILNKVAATRALCDALEEHATRLRATLQRTLADQTALAAAYEAAARQVKAASAQHARISHDAQLQYVAQAEKLHLSLEHGSKMESLAILAQQQLEKERGAARDEARAAAERADVERSAARDEARAAAERADVLCARLHQLEAERAAARDEARAAGERAEVLCARLHQLEMERSAARDEARAAAERADVLRARGDQQEQRAQRAEASLREMEQNSANLRQEIERREAEARAEAERREAEARAEAERREAEARAEAERNAQLQAELQRAVEARSAALVAAEARVEASAQEAVRLRASLAALDESYEDRTHEMALMCAQIKNQETVIESQKGQLVSLTDNCEQLHVEIGKLSKEIAQKDSEAREAAARQQSTQRELEETRIARDEAVDSARAELQAEINQHASAAATANQQLQALQEHSAAAAATAATEAAAAERELAERAETVSKLMNELTAEQARCEDKLQAAVRAKDDVDQLARSLDSKLQVQGKKLSSQNALIQNMGIEKEKLQDEIRKLQATIAVVQKEVACQPSPAVMRAAAASKLRCEPPQREDDNALLEPPSPSRVKKVKSGKKDYGCKRPRAELEDSLLNNFSYDSSQDSNALDPVAVERRFDAMMRGEPLPKISLQSLTRGHIRKQGSAQRPMGRPPTPTPVAQAPRSFFRTKRLDKATGKK